MRPFVPALAALLALAPAAAARAQAADPAPPAEVLVLGVYHFDNPGLDVVKNEVADVLTPPKQAEVEAVAEALARFRPTRIAVEVRAERAARLDSLYRAYREGRHALGRNEVQQLGFRLAARFGHPRLYATDHDGAFPFAELMAYAARHDTAFVAEAQAELARITGEMNLQQREWNVGRILRAQNDPAWIARGHALYMRMARVGADDTFVGADLVAAWYARNLRIFASVQRLAEPGERVLVIYGAGHAAILRELVRSTPGMRLVEAADYLPGGGS